MSVLIAGGEPPDPYRPENVLPIVYGHGGINPGSTITVTCLKEA